MYVSFLSDFSEQVFVFVVFLHFFKFLNESSDRSIHLKFDHQTISNSPSSDVELSDFVNACFWHFVLFLIKEIAPDLFRKQCSVN